MMMWQQIAKDMKILWKAAEAWYLQIGHKEMANRANRFTVSSPRFDRPRRPPGRGTIGSSSPGNVRREGTNPVGGAVANKPGDILWSARARERSEHGEIFSFFEGIFI